MAFALVTVLSRWSAKLNTQLSSGLIAGLYLIWIGITIAALTGASRMLPHAGQGYRAAPQIEFAVAGLIVAGSILSIVTVLFLFIGLRQKQPIEKSIFVRSKLQSFGARAQLQSVIVPTDFNVQVQQNPSGSTKDAE